jgi:hypothetical protein
MRDKTIDDLLNKFSEIHCDLPEYFWLIVGRQDIQAIVEAMIERHYAERSPDDLNYLMVGRGELFMIGLRKSRMSGDELMLQLAEHPEYVGVLERENFLFLATKARLYGPDRARDN